MPTRTKSGDGAGRLVDEEPDDQAADDGADEEPAEADEVTTAQPRARRGFVAAIVHSPAPVVDSLRSTASLDSRAKA